MGDSVVIPFVVTFLNLGFYLVVDPLLRKDATARSREPTKHDSGTTRLIGVVFAISWLAMLGSAVLNRYRIAIVEPHLVFGMVGLVLMVSGAIIRTIAMRTLGKFFTRTLVMREAHRVVSTGIYRRIRHPGYLADLLLFGGSGIATSNVIGTVVIIGVLLPAFVRRIAVEERMLREAFGQEYVEYSGNTWKLIPFVF